MNRKAFESADWTTDSLNEIWTVIKDIAINEFKLDFFDPYFEVVTFEEMLQIYTTGFPVMFNHWTFGKDYENLYKQYRHNRTSIAYEVIFNTNPALCYLLENNTTTMQALVMSHAAVGHSTFFKQNEFFKEHTNPNTILNYLKNFRNYATECEQKYDAKRVEEILDVCQSLSLYAIDKSEAIELTKNVKEKKALTRALEQEKDYDRLVEELKPETTELLATKGYQRLHEENILKFIAKNSPSLKSWERELIFMFCKTQQYFYPCRLTKLMNEGYASFWHYQLMNRLYDLGYLSEGNVLEFLQSHTSVLCQHDHDSEYYRGINVYKLGYEIFNDIKRICENPTDEDRYYFPGLIGKNWIEEVNYAAANFKDDSFILQYLSPKVVRDLKLFKVADDTTSAYYQIAATCQDEDFKEIRKTLSMYYNFANHIPQVYVEGCDLRRSRTLYLVLKDKDNKQFEENNTIGTLWMIKKLWTFPVRFKHTTEDGITYAGEVKEL